MRILLDEDLNTRLRHAFSDQDNLANYDLAVVGSRARSKSLDDLEELIPETERILPSLRPGEVRRIHPR